MTSRTMVAPCAHSSTGSHRVVCVPYAVKHVAWAFNKSTFPGGNKQPIISSYTTGIAFGYDDKTRQEDQGFVCY
jgi:hypothetical protein